MGIPLDASAGGGPEAALRDLATRARAGDKRAQLELGIAFEEGRGVPQDLVRAEALYFSAATQPSAKRTATYLPRGDGGGTLKVLPVGVEYSGNQEALLRWAALSRRRANRGAGAVGAGEGPGMLEDPSELATRQRTATLSYTFLPIFNGLKSGSADWRAKLASEDPVVLISPLSIDHSFRLLVSHDALEVPHAVAPSISSDFCNRRLGPAPPSSPDFRLAGLCALRHPDLGRQLLPVVVDAAILAGQSDVESDGRARVTADLLFLFRVVSYLDQPALRGRLAEAIQRAMPPASEAQACDEPGCRSADEASERRFRAAHTQVLLAALEQPERARNEPWFERALIEASRSIALSAGGAGPRQGPSPISAACESLGIAQSSCRKELPFEPFLDSTVARVLAAFVSGTGQDLPQRCGGLLEAIEKLADELAGREDLRVQLARFTEVQCNIQKE